MKALTPELRYSNGRKAKRQHASEGQMQIFVMFLMVAALAGCARQQMAWQRFDGQSVHASPALEQQATVDLANCRAVAINAGNGVPTPAPTPRTTVNNSVTVNAGPGSGMPQAPSPGDYQASQVDFSPLADAGAAIGANARRSQTEEANLQACMAQRGYQLAAVPAR
jgi:hypothetical protein